jgi:hypothetical protein
MPLASARDRSRLERLSRQIERYERLADESTDERRKSRYLKVARSVERQQRFQRIFPMSVWLWSSLPGFVLLPWALFAHAGHTAVGLAASGFLLIVLATSSAVRRLRRRG